MVHQKPDFSAKPHWNRAFLLQKLPANPFKNPRIKVYFFKMGVWMGVNLRQFVVDFRLLFVEFVKHVGVYVCRCSEVWMSQPFLHDFHRNAYFKTICGECVTKLVEATNGHSLVEAENAICYDIVRGYGLRRSLFGRRGVFLHGTKKQKTSVYRNV